MKRRMGNKTKGMVEMMKSRKQGSMFRVSHGLIPGIHVDNTTRSTSDYPKIYFGGGGGDRFSLGGGGGGINFSSTFG